MVEESAAHSSNLTLSLQVRAQEEQRSRPIGRRLDMCLIGRGTCEGVVGGRLINRFRLGLTTPQAVAACSIFDGVLTTFSFKRPLCLLPLCSLPPSNHPTLITPTRPYPRPLSMPTIRSVPAAAP